MGLFGAVLTAFYMTRQVYYVFFGADRTEKHAHESPRVMTIPLAILAVAAIVVGFFGTPAWPWLHSYLTGEHTAELNFGALGHAATLMIVSTVVVAIGIGSAWLLYSRKCPQTAKQPDPLEAAQPSLWRVLANRFYIDELYEATVIRLNAFGAALSDWLDRVVWNGLIEVTKFLADGFARISRAIDQDIVNSGFDESCGGIRSSSGLFSRFQNGRVQSMVILVLLLLWGCRS
jgi:NADH-quinone oxidoreductase subunit L